MLKAIVEDGKNRPVQLNADTLLKQVEQQAAGELAQAKQMLDKGKTNEASMMLTKLVSRIMPAPRPPPKQPAC